jgi:phosphopantetheinyl transferase
MKKRVLFFAQKPPEDKNAIHIWVGKAALPHEELLCRLIGLYLGSPPSKLTSGPGGKPYLPDSPLHFNLSDSEDWLAIAFHWGTPVGIDLEVIRPIEEMDPLILNCFSKREQVYVREKETLARFWEIWNRKEACLKALGLGLQDRMAEWDCFGKNWVEVKDVWVSSCPMKHNLSAAVAFSKGSNG